MREASSLIWRSLVGLFRSRVSLAAEVLVLRHQINVLRRNSPKRQAFSFADHLIFVGLYRLAPTVLNALAIVKPETVIKWHRAGFRSYWRWKSRRGGGRPTVAPEIRKLIREMSIANPLWERRGSMENSSRSASISDRPAWPSTWPSEETRHPKAGGRSFAIMPTASPRWICSSYRQSHFVCSTAC